LVEASATFFCPFCRLAAFAKKAEKNADVEFFAQRANNYIMGTHG